MKLFRNEKRFVRFIAGLVVTSGTALGLGVNEWFLILPLFAGLNLLQSSISGICPPEIFHSKFIKKEYR
ncbi:MAG: YgaP-like transmembrane domain [Candidatus Nanohaloarchaea archaeon]